MGVEGGFVERVKEKPKIFLIGSANDPKYRQRILQIADRCPVHQTLHSDLKIQTQLA